MPYYFYSNCKGGSAAFRFGSFRFLIWVLTGFRFVRFAAVLLAVRFGSGLRVGSRPSCKGFQQRFETCTKVYESGTDNCFQVFRPLNPIRWDLDPTTLKQ